MTPPRMLAFQLAHHRQGAKRLCLEAEELAVCVADLMVIGQSVNPLRKALLLDHSALRTRAFNVAWQSLGGGPTS